MYASDLCIGWRCDILQTSPGNKLKYGPQRAGARITWGDPPPPPRPFRCTLPRTFWRNHFQRPPSSLFPPQNHFPPIWPRIKAESDHATPPIIDDKPHKFHFGKCISFIGLQPQHSGPMNTVEENPLHIRLHDPKSDIQDGSQIMTRKVFFFFFKNASPGESSHHPKRPVNRGNDSGNVGGSSWQCITCTQSRLEMIICWG